MHHAATSPPRLLAKIVREVAAAERFASFADFVPAVRARLTRLRIPYTPAAFDDAINLVAASLRLVHGPEERPQPQAPPEMAPPSRQHAAAILAGLRRVLEASGPRSMPAARPIRPAQAARLRFERDRARALNAVLDEIEAAAARCAALEEAEP